MDGREGGKNPGTGDTGVGGGGGWGDGNRLDGRTAAATITSGEYLGRYATVMDAEMLAVALGWELGDTLITDSQAAIGMIRNLKLEYPKRGNERRVTAAAKRGAKRIAWVNGHTGVMGN